MNRNLITMIAIIIIILFVYKLVSYVQGFNLRKLHLNSSDYELRELLRLGDTFRACRNFEMAIQSYEKAVHLKPSDDVLW